MLLILEMEGLLFSQITSTKGKDGLESLIWDFKHRSKLCQSQPNGIEFFEFCLSWFKVGILSSKSETDVKSLFQKFLGDKEKHIEEKKKMGQLINAIQKC